MYCAVVHSIKVIKMCHFSDSCTRQFPEFAPRARKRIRTYLKSCRRTKRTREQAGLDGVNARPAPPHLTSIQAEQLLAKACENESENAKRMRMGLEPISQPMPAVSTHSIVDVLSQSSGNSPATPVSMSALFPNMSAVTSEPSVTPKTPKSEYKPEQLATLLQAAASQQGSTTLTPVMSSAQVCTTLITQPISEIFNDFPSIQGLTVTPTNGNFQSFNGTTLYKQSFGPQANGGTAFPPTATLLQNPSPLQNGKIHL